MELQPYVDSIRQQLLVAAEAGGEEARALAERLVAPLESAMRLTLLSALSSAADEITRDLAPGSVDLRLRGLEPSFVVSTPQTEWDDDPRGATMTPSPQPDVEDGATARINFRPPENLKTRIDEAASKEGLSVNAWLVRAVHTVLSSGGVRMETRSSGAQSFTGWVR